MKYLASAVNLGYAAVDWLSCSGNDSISSDALWQLGERLLNRAKLEGENPTRWHGHGYDGWSVTGVSVGSRKQSTLVRLSGKQAAYEWQHAVRAADNVSRLDLAVDVYCHRPMTTNAVQLYRDSGHKSSRSGRPMTRTLVVCSDGGQTCYLGKRVSDEMGRLYDKGVESRTNAPGTRWRYEVEYKRAPALNAAQRLLLAEDEAQTISSTVAHWFSDRGGRTWPASAELALRKWSREATSVDQKVQWLARCVRPTVVALTDTLGYHRVSTAVGLSSNPSFSRQSAVEKPED